MQTGQVSSVEMPGGAMHILVNAPGIAHRLTTGDSIAVSGVCLTALAITEQGFEADLLAETVRRTSLAHLAPGRTVNLELPTPAGTPLGGHIVQGHVDATGTLLAFDAVHPESPESSDWTLRFSLPPALGRYIVEKGSITVEGISLTVAAVHRSGASLEVTIAVIPHTYSVTNLHTLCPGDLLNIEVDVLAKYAEQRQQQTAEHGMTEFSLIAEGY